MLLRPTYNPTMDTEMARQVGFDLLAPDLPRRWSHVQGVANAAESGEFDHRVRPLIVAAALLHDIGYARPLVEVGFHPIDGARYLRKNGADERVTNLVAHHSCAHIEAELRGLRSILDEEFPRDDSLPHDELCFCDMTTSPDGELVTIDERLTEIRSRHGEGSIVHNFIDLAEPELRAAAERVTGGGDQPK